VLVKEWSCVTMWSWLLYRVNQILVSNPVSKNDLIHHCLFSSFDKWPGNELDYSGVRFRARYFYHLPKFQTIFPQENTAGSWSWPSPPSSTEDKKYWSYTLKPHKVSSSTHGPCKGRVGRFRGSIQGKRVLSSPKVPDHLSPRKYGRVVKLTITSI